MTKTASALRRPGVKTDTRTLVALAAGLVVTLWMADQIEMDLFMAFVLWVLIAVRTIFHENKTALTGTLVALAVWAIVLPFFQDSGGGFIEDATQALALTVMALGLNIIVGFAGLLDLGYVAFYALGALTAGWFMSGFVSRRRRRRGLLPAGRRAGLEPARHPLQLPAGDH